MKEWYSGFPHLNSHHHVEMTLAVLFNDIPYIIRLACLLKLAASNEVLDLTNGPYRVAVCLRQSKRFYIQLRICVTSFNLSTRNQSLNSNCYLHYTTNYTPFSDRASNLQHLLVPIFSFFLL